MLQKEDEKMIERINLLEMAVYKIESSTGGKTKFDEIEDKFVDIQTN